MNTEIAKKHIEKSIMTYNMFNFQSNKSYAEGQIVLSKALDLITVKEAADYQGKIDKIIIQID
ncbi:MAG: hypothetical protein JJE17_01785 [Peptostreptococcaceae bacterium]|nr:hypothetical protein [Peptostreptococcaceae bacterium]